MKLLLFDATFEGGSSNSDILDNKILKDIAFSRKLKSPVLTYNNIMIPIINENEKDEEYLLNKAHLKDITSGKCDNDDIYSLFNLFKDYIQTLKGMKINIIRKMDDFNINISYTDGSSSLKEQTASYACCKLLKETQDPTKGLVDDFTGKRFLYESYSGMTKVPTNNVGELTGIKTAIEHFGDSKYQLIISDSNYGIKTFREYIHVWKENGYKGSNKQDIKNKELILEIQKEIEDCDKIIIYKWVKGHDGHDFNEECDKLAVAARTK